MSGEQLRFANYARHFNYLFICNGLTTGSHHLGQPCFTRFTLHQRTTCKPFRISGSHPRSHLLRVPMCLSTQCGLGRPILQQRSHLRQRCLPSRRDPPLLPSREWLAWGITICFTVNPMYHSSSCCDRELSLTVMLLTPVPHAAMRRTAPMPAGTSTGVSRP